MASMSLKSFSIYIVKFLELYISAVLLVANCITVRATCTSSVILSKEKNSLVEPFLIVCLHLQWNAVLTQIMLCLAEAVLRNSRFFCVNPY